jgi:hypothetical protein
MYTNPRHSSYLVEQLLIRRQRILERYFATLSPVADVKVVDASKLCATDLARQAGTFAADKFRYTATSFAGRDLARSPLVVEVADQGRICAPLAHFAKDGESDDSASRYLIVDIDNGKAKGALRAHLYDLGSQRGFRLVGVERPEDQNPPSSFD